MIYNLPLLRCGSAHERISPIKVNRPALRPGPQLLPLDALAAVEGLGRGERPVPLERRHVHRAGAHAVETEKLETVFYESGRRISISTSAEGERAGKRGNRSRDLCAISAPRERRLLAQASNARGASTCGRVSAAEREMSANQTVEPAVYHA